MSTAYGGESIPFPSLDPQRPWKQCPAKIVQIQDEAPAIQTYRLEFQDPQLQQDYRFLPGQFNMLYLPGFGESAISISSDPHRPQWLLHTVRAVGNVTRALTRLQVGDPILLRGPFGSSWPVDDCRDRDLVIACGGLGLPPLRPVIYDVLQRRSHYRQVSLLYGARRPSDLLFTAEYESWRAAGIDVHLTVDLGDDQWTGDIGVVPTLFQRLALDPDRTVVLTCGPEIMMRFVCEAVRQLGIPSQQIFLSMERNMNCAIGHCGHCQLGGTFVCRDGPVFRHDQMEAFLYLEDY